MRKSIFLLILLVIVLSGGLLRYILASNFGYEEDIREGYRVFAAKVVIKGPFDLYVPDENLDVDYPPVLPWIFAAMSKLGGGLGAGQYPLFKRGLAVLLALGDMALILLLAAIAGARSQKAALVTATAWSANPASLFDTGYWSQPNPFHLLFACLGLWMVVKQKWLWSGIFLGIGCLIKPQIWPLLLPMALWIWRDGGMKSLGRAFVGWLIPIAIVWLGFLGFGRAPTLKYLFINSMAGHLGLSMGAHNLWWIVQVFWQRGIGSEELWLGGISAGTIAWTVAVAVLIVLLGLWWRKNRKERNSDGAEMVVLWALWFFLLAPQQHENHAMMALALLAVIWAMGRKVGMAFAAMSLLIPLNCLLHDERLMRALFIQPTEGLAAWILTPGTYTNNFSPLTALVSLASLAVGIVWWVRYFWIRKAAQA